MAKEEKVCKLLYFNSEVKQQSPVQEDVARKAQYDEDGNEFVVYEKVDYPKFQQSLGSVDNWSLNALLAAGINPDFPIHTGNGTRLEGLNSIAEFDAMANEILSEAENKSE